MFNLSSLEVVLYGIVFLVLLLHEKARFAAALIVFLVVVIAAADVFGIDLRFWE